MLFSVAAKTTRLKELANAERQHEVRENNKIWNCEDITISMCSHLSYNTTIFPNIRGHNSQDEAALELHQYRPLIEIGCSPMLR